MTRSQVLFKIIDVLMKRPQNAIKYEGVTIIKDVPYNDEGGKSTSGDIYFEESLLPDNGKYPIIFNIHGGGFIMGDKSYRKCLCSFYAKNGYIVYNINFRMPKEQYFTGILKDCVQALNHLTSLSQEYPIDLNKIVLTGDSSGAFIALCLAAIRCNKNFREALNAPEITVDVAAIAPLCGMCDLKKIMEKPLPFGIFKDISELVFNYETDKKLSNLSSNELYDYFNPVDFIDNRCPNALVAWAENDLICKGQGKSTADTLREKNCKVETYFTCGLFDNHCYHLQFKKKHAKLCMEKMMRFLKENLNINTETVKV